MSDTEYDNRNSPSYLAHYAMRRAPFSTKHEADMFYPEPSRVQRLDILMHLTQYSNEMLLVTGPEGIGKTTLLQQFLNKTHESWKVCSIDAHARMDNDQLIQHIVRGFKLTLDNSPRSKYDKLTYQLELALADTQTVVIAVDNAHVLPPQTLAMLASIAKIRNTLSGANIRVILFCEPQIKIKFASGEMEKHKQSDHRKIDLPPFSEQQTRELLLHRTRLAGLKADNTFTDAAVAKLYKQSEGIPGVIVELAHRVLFEMTPVKRRVKPKLNKNGETRRFPTLGTIIAIVIVILLLLAIVYQNKLNALYLSHLQKTVDLDVANAQIIDNATSFNAIENEAENTLKYMEGPELNALFNPGSKTDVTAIGKQVQLARTADSSIYREQWLLQQNPQAYTLQLLVSLRRATIDKFLSDHELPSTELAYFQIHNDGKKWHSLVFGVYPNYNKATLALAQLPSQLRNPRPWIRQIKDIHVDIQQNDSSQ